MTTKTMTGTDMTNALVSWSRSEAKAQVEWIKAAHPNKHSAKELDAYEAGFIQGYKGAIRALQLHGFVSSK